MRNKLNKLWKRRRVASPSDSIGQSPSVGRSLTPGRKTPLQHEMLQPCRSAFRICRQVTEKTTIIKLTLYAIWLWGSKFYVFAKKPVFPYNKDLLVITSKCWLLLRWFRQPMSHSQLLNNPSINLLSSVLRYPKYTNPRGSFVRNRGHG